MTVWPLTVYFVSVLLIVVAMLGISYVLGQRHSEPATGSQYESGILSQGSAHARLSVKFFLVAAFVVFDLEAVFLFLWAVAGRELGWPDYIEAPIFAGILLAALVYPLFVIHRCSIRRDCWGSGGRLACPAQPQLRTLEFYGLDITFAALEASDIARPAIRKRALSWAWPGNRKVRIVSYAASASGHRALRSTSPESLLQ